MINILYPGISLILLCAALACSTPSQRLDPGGILLSNEIEFDSADPESALELIPLHGEVHLEEADNHLVARYRLTDERIQIVARSGRAVGQIAPLLDNQKGFEIFTADGSEPSYRLRLEPDGDLKLQSADGRILYKLKRRDYGIKVISQKDQSESKVRLKAGKISVRNEAGQTLFSTRDKMPVAAAACLSLIDFPLELGAGLSLALIHWGDPID